jgi:hypothetical protein
MTRKRKKSKTSPGEEKLNTSNKRRENKQRQTKDNMDNDTGQKLCSDSSKSEINSPHTSQYGNTGVGYMNSPSMNIATGPYQTWGLINPGLTQTPQTPSSPLGAISSDIVSVLLQRLDSMDSKLAKLETIQTSVNSLNLRIQNMDKKINDLERKVLDIERSREFDSQTFTEISKQQKGLDTYMKKMEKFEKEHKEMENALKAEIIDLKSRSMRDNLLFHKLPEEKDENCEEKIKHFIQDKLKIDNASDTIRLQRAHRVGPFKAGKIRPIVASSRSFTIVKKFDEQRKNLKDQTTGFQSSSLRRSWSNEGSLYLSCYKLGRMAKRLTLKSTSYI